VLVSSKTLAEIELYRREMALPDPVVGENGAVIDVPAGYFPAGDPATIATIDRVVLQEHFDAIRDGYDCISFAELGVQGIAEATGLPIGEAELANQRRASEPVLWNDTEEHLAEFTEAAAARGLSCVRGGRFVHLMGAFDKADAVTQLCAAYRRKWPDAMLESIALGDGPNDLDMLRAADVAVVIRGRHAHPMPLENHAHVLRPTAPGPEGWAEAIHELIGV
jgi:mannosyl-3-phosphoglycerate phosphatase